MKVIIGIQSLEVASNGSTPRPFADLGSYYLGITS